MTQSHQHPRSGCPACGIALEMSTNVGRGGAPDPGDISVCIGCGAILTFNPDLSLRRITAEEEENLPVECARMIFLAQQAIVMIDRAAPGQSTGASRGQT